MMIKIEKESISEVELVKRWRMNPFTFLIRKENGQVPKRFLHNMTSRYLVSDVEAFETKNGIVAASHPPPTGNSWSSRC
ncbi:MAG: hypothetical protein WC856_26515 [Methylococcaceae bacterium]|jgi:hypothetical protein